MGENFCRTHKCGQSCVLETKFIPFNHVCIMFHEIQLGRIENRNTRVSLAGLCDAYHPCSCKTLLLPGILPT